MPRVKVRFFGFGSKASGFDTRTEDIVDGTSLRQFWDELRSAADDGDLLARIDERQVFFIRNGELVSHDRMKKTVVEDGDTVSIMVLAVGGST